MPEHKDLTGADLHEPKGAATASSGQIYIADGLGSGAWENNVGNTHGEMTITNNAVPEVTPLAVDLTLNTDSDYTKIITGWSGGHLHNTTFNTDELVIGVAGGYLITAWVCVQLPSNNQKVGFKYAINDAPPYSSQKMIGTSAAAGDIVTVSASGFVLGLSVTDTISLYMATDKTADPIILEAGCHAYLLDQS